MTKHLWLLFALAFMFSVNQNVHSAGFALIEQSVSSMGNAYAGGAAIAEDASTIFFNPAGISRLCGCQAVAGIHAIFPSAQFHNDDSILTPLLPAAANPGPGSPMTGNNGNDAGRAAAVTNFYYSHQINDCWAVGLAITSPYGLVTDYNKNWVGRYHALRSAALTIEFNPVVSYQVLDCLSIGGGIREMYLHAKLTNAVDYGTIAWLGTLELPAGQQGPVQAGLTGLGFEPQTQDGRVRVKGNSWAFGGNAGFLWEPWCGTRIGGSWRSQMKHKVKGTEKFTKLPALVADPSLAGGLESFFAGIQAAAGTNTQARSTVTLPDMWEISVYHDLNECWALMADLTYTRWSTLKDLVFTFKNPNQDPAVTTLKWKNVFKYAFGANYRPNCCWVLRAGVAYDTTPIRSKELRTPRIPGESRLWTAFGFGYTINACTHIDVGYAHLFVKDPKVDKSGFEYSEDHVRGGLRGKYKAHTDIVSAQVVVNF